MKYRYKWWLRVTFRETGRWAYIMERYTIHGRVGYRFVKKYVG